MILKTQYDMLEVMFFYTPGVAQEATLCCLQEALEPYFEVEPLELDKRDFYPSEEAAIEAAAAQGFEWVNDYGAPRKRCARGAKMRCMHASAGNAPCAVPVRRGCDLSRVHTTSKQPFCDGSSRPLPDIRSAQRSPRLRPV